MKKIGIRKGGRMERRKEEQRKEGTYLYVSIGTESNLPISRL